MNDLSDQQLLREYAERHSEAAFTELVRRHVDLVHSAAGRMTSDTHSAEDVTQAVFLALAQNAARLSRHPVLAGWLHTTARHLAAKTVRTATRRHLREQEAAAMNQHSANEPCWDDVAPHLDAALGELNDAERDAILLRYFEKKSAPEIAAVIGISAAAAQKRVDRAVERLRESFSQRGVTIGAGGLAVIGAHAVQATPMGFAATIAAATLAAPAVSAVSVITTTKAIAMTTLQKMIVTATLVLLAGTSIYEARQATQLRKQNQALEQQQAPMMHQVQHSQANGDDAANSVARLREENAQLRSNQTGLLKLRGEVGTLRQQANDADQRANAAEEKLSATLSSAAVFKEHEFATINAAKMLNYNFRVFAASHDNQFPTFPTNLREFSEQMGDSSSIGGIGLGSFEYVNPGTGWATQANAVVLRERLARQAVDGSWMRIYAFTDGSVQTALSHDGNFEAWEKLNTH